MIASSLSPDARVLQKLRAGGRVTEADLGMSGDVLRARVESLREAGYEIEEQPGAGFRLLAAPDRLIADDLGGRLTGSLVREILVFEETASTNDVALQLGRNGAASGVAVFAEKQTAGRGRLGRRWESESHAGLWFSLLLRPELPFAQWPRLTTWAAVAIAEALEDFVPSRALIKWPNDLQIEGRKVVGILTESALDQAQQGFAVIGVGVNVNQTVFPDELAGKAGSLRLAAGRAIDRAELAAALLRSLEAWLPRLLADFPSVIRAATERSSLLGQTVCALGGESRVEGTAIALDAEGALQIRTRTDELITVSAGEVTLSSERLPTSRPDSGSS